uniref:hypothetical protein n=1 Tax=Faecousia sp. TaxID=2952921 RepID=UPI004026A1C4
MFFAPFWLVFLVSDYRILLFRRFRKGVILSFGLPLQCSPGNFRKTHSRYVADSRSLRIQGLQRVESTDVPKILCLEIKLWVYTAASKQHIAYAVLKQQLEHGLYGLRIQYIQVAFRFAFHKCRKIILKVILYGIVRRRNQCYSKGLPCVQTAEPVFQSFCHRILIFLVNLPYGNRFGFGTFVGVRNIKEVSNTGLPIKHGNSFCATVYPPPKPTIPAIAPFNGQHGSGIGLLGI